MLIKSLTIKNFLSFGNTPETIRLDSLNSTIISGQVGAGKSTIGEAITFGLYGKTLRNLKKSEISNKLNKKDCLVEIEFDSKGHQYKVRRGISPNIFEIYKDGVLVNQSASVLDYQGVLETEVIGYNFHLFKQLIVLNPVSYMSFFEMKTGARRELLEELLGLQEVSTMNQFLQGYISENRSQTTSVSASLKEVGNTIKTLHSGIKESKEKQNNNLDTIRTELEALRTKRATVQQKFDAINSKALGLNDESTLTSRITEQETLLRRMGDLVVEMKSIVARNNKELQFLKENHECPMCHQEIGTDHKDNLTNQLQDVNDVTVSKMETVLNKIEQVKGHQTADKTTLDEYRNILKTSEQLSYALKLLDKDIQNLELRLTETVDDSNVQFLESELMSAIGRLEEFQQQMAELTKQSQLYNSVKDFLSDSGIRKVVVAKYVPYVVSRINYWLERLNLFARIKINEDFEEEIRLRGFDPTSYANLSSGEKAKVSLSLVFAFRELLALKTNSNISILCFDEILENLDYQSKQDLFYTLRGIATKENITILTVSHSVVSDFSPFDARLVVEKSGQFSKIRIGEV